MHHFLNHVKATFPELVDAKILIAVSGGVDSMVLLHLMHTSDYNIGIAHVNFQLRGEDSDGDEEFITDYARQKGIECHVQRADTALIAKERKQSIQLIAREIRYDYFSNLVEEKGYEYVLTAHHLDDQLETFLMNLNRGAGLRGLTGIPERNGTIMRPLLPFWREDILEYAKSHDIKWREDSSNASTAYQRNLVRHNLLPVIKKSLPDLKSHFKDSLSYLKESQLIVDDVVLRFRESVIQTTGNGIQIPLRDLEHLIYKKTLLHHILQPYGITNITDVLSLIERKIAGKHVASNEFTAHVKEDMLVIQQNEQLGQFYLQISEPGRYVLPHGILTIEHISYEQFNHEIASNNDNFRCYLSLEREIFPLTLRTPRTGEKIQPYGMNGSKLISDILTDAKVSFIDKEKALVLTSENRILWVLGHRTSKHHQVKETNSPILKLTYFK